MYYLSRPRKHLRTKIKKTNIKQRKISKVELKEYLRYLKEIEIC
jgi:hypothetical protein